MKIQTHLLVLSALFLLCGCKTSPSSNTSKIDSGNVDSNSSQIVHSSENTSSNSNKLVHSEDNVTNLYAYKTNNNYGYFLDLNVYSIKIINDGDKSQYTIGSYTGYFISFEHVTDALFKPNEFDNETVQQYMIDTFKCNEIKETKYGYFGIKSEQHQPIQYEQKTALKGVYKIYKLKDAKTNTYSKITGVSESQMLFLYKDFIEGFTYSSETNNYVFHPELVNAKKFYALTPMYRVYIETMSMNRDSDGCPIKLQADYFPTCVGYKTIVEIEYGEQTVNLPSNEQIIQNTCIHQNTEYKNTYIDGEMRHFECCTNCQCSFNVDKCVMGSDGQCQTCGQEFMHYKTCFKHDGITFDYEIRDADNKLCSIATNAIGYMSMVQPSKVEYFQETQEVIISKISYSGITNSIVVYYTSLNNVNKAYIVSQDTILAQYTLGQVIS